MRRRLVMGLVMLFNTHAWADSWHILFYMDASDNLSDMAVKNITDMMRGKPNDSITFFIQLHAYHQAGLRYQLTDQGLQFLEEVILTGDCKQDLIDAASWGFANQTADHTMLILSNHGWGILDPRWNEQTERWEVLNDESETTCPIKRSTLMHHHQRHKGYMFNNTSHTYLTNTDLIESLDNITSNLLKNKQIDILAFDTCMGAMIEVAYQVAPFARYMIGSQSCSLNDGFDYQGIVHTLNSIHNAPSDVACGMVKAFDAYYSKYDDSGIYTHTAFKLTHINDVLEALNTVVEQTLSFPEALDLLDEVRMISPRFCMWPMYTDIIEFCRILNNKIKSVGQSEKADALAQAIEHLISMHARMIVARCGGHKTKDVAHGSAIYCPFNTIDSSYEQTLFVQKCRWIDLLKIVCLNTCESNTGWSVT